MLQSETGQSSHRGKDLCGLTSPWAKETPHAAVKPEVLEVLMQGEDLDATTGVLIGLQRHQSLKAAMKI